MYDVNVINALMSRLDSLQAENERLREMNGEFGFFSTKAFGINYGKIKRIKENITVDEYELINNVRISSQPEDIKRVIDVLQRLYDKGLFNEDSLVTSSPTPYSYGPSGQYPFLGNPEFARSPFTTPTWNTIQTPGNVVNDIKKENEPTEVDDEDDE